MKESTLATLLSILQIASNVAAGSLAGTGTAESAAKLSAGLTEIVQKALLAHQEVLGAPIDPDLIKPFDPIV